MKYLRHLAWASITNPQQNTDRYSYITDEDKSNVPCILEVQLVKVIMAAETHSSITMIRSFLWSRLLSTLFASLPISPISFTVQFFFSLNPSPPKPPRCSSGHRKWEELTEGVTSSPKKEEIKIKIGEIRANLTQAEQGSCPESCGPETGPQGNKTGSQHLGQ